VGGYKLKLVPSAVQLPSLCKNTSSFLTSLGVLLLLLCTSSKSRPAAVERPPASRSILSACDYQTQFRYIFDILEALI
jgi:hypothetical protein